MRCCEYYPIAITNGNNENIYLESDYQAIDHNNLEADLEDYESSKLEAIKEIEAELAERRAIAADIVS